MNNENEKIKLNKKLIIEESTKKVEKEKGSIFLGFILVCLIIGAIGYCLYYLDKKEIINLPDFPDIKEIIIPEDK